MEPESQAPPVVAVIVCANPGAWFEESLSAIAGLDYPNLSLLIIDSGSDVDPTPRVAAVAPSAFVRRLPENRGFAASANEVLGVVEGASHYLFCHDDVAPDPDALGLLLEEAFRSNAGVVAPKLVDWHDPTLLLQVGSSIDKSGAPAPSVDRGELDQEQHDAVRDVFVAPGGCTLVRADLFAALGGFDPGMFLFGEDLDLSWRAQIAGARVVVAPGARVRHLEALSSGRRVAGGTPRITLDELRPELRPLQLRHRLRAVLCDYGRFHLLRVLPQLVLLATVEAAFGVVTGHAATSRDIVRAWRWNLSRTSEIRTRRALVRSNRQLPDSEVRRLQTRGSARMNAFLRGQLAPDRRLRMRAVRFGSVEERAPALRLPLVVGAVVALVLFAGSRHLLGGSQAAIGELSPFPAPWSGLLRPFLSGWRTTGLGAEAPAPAAFGLLGLAGVVLLGHMALLQQVLVLGMLPLGAVGAHRLVAPLGSSRTRLVAAVAYLATPLPYNAIARGHWSGILAFGAAPWVVARLLRVAGSPPFGEGRPAAFARHVVPLAIMFALLGSVAPAVPLVFVLASLGLALGGVLTGAARGLWRGVGLAAAATVAAAILLFPWSLDFALPGASASALTGIARPHSAALGLGAVLRFHTGPIGGAPVGWAFLLAAGLPLVLGGGERLAWAGRLWMMSITLWLVAWAGGRGWFHVGMPPAEALLAPAALGVAVCVALGLASFEVDLSAYRFGWRQVASVVAAVAVAIAAAPVAVASFSGRWHQPANDFNRVLSWMPEHRAEGTFRVLWLGDPDALPLGSWSLGGGLAYATSRNGPPTVADRWPDAAAGPSHLLADDVRAAQRGRTTQLGHLLGPLAVRYIVVPTSQAPSKQRAAATPVPPSLTAALGNQVDLKQLESDEALQVYENAEWVPARAVLDAPADEASRHTDARSLAAAELAGATPALRGGTVPTAGRGRVPDAAPVFVSESASAGWHLKASGAEVPRRRAFGWANAFDVERGGTASLSFHTSPMRGAAVLIEVLLWGLAIRTVVAWGRERRRAVAAARGGAEGPR